VAAIPHLGHASSAQLRAKPERVVGPSVVDLGPYAPADASRELDQSRCGFGLLVESGREDPRVICAMVLRSFRISLLYACKCGSRCQSGIGACFSSFTLIEKAKIGLPGEDPREGHRVHVGIFLTSRVVRHGSPLDVSEIVV
jgi:hypothetical protein